MHGIKHGNLGVSVKYVGGKSGACMCLGGDMECLVGRRCDSTVAYNIAGLGDYWVPASIQPVS